MSETKAKTKPKAKTKNSEVKRRKNRANPRVSDLVSKQNRYNIAEGDNAKVNSIALELFMMHDIDLSDPEQVHNRIIEFFEVFEKHDSKPTPAALAMALNGHGRQWLISLATGDKQFDDFEKLPSAVLDSIKKAYKYTEISFEQNLVNGKIQPVSAIFMMKNNYGYKDNVDYTVHAEAAEQLDTADIRKRYAIDAEVTETPKKIE